MLGVDTSMDSSNNLKNDAIDIRIQKLKQQVDEITDGQMTSEVSDDCPPEIEEAFWNHMIAFEQAEGLPLFDVLVSRGLSLPPPDELNDSQLTEKLWEVIEEIAHLGAYLYSTNHLSDRELYKELWNDVLRVPMVLMPEEPDFACHIDLIGGGSEEDIFLYLKYYADEDARREWAEEWPEYNLPEHKELPFERDCHLPQRDWNRY